MNDEHVTAWVSTVLGQKAVDPRQEIVEIMRKHRYDPEYIDLEAGLLKYVHGIMSDIRHCGDINFMEDR